MRLETVGKKLEIIGGFAVLEGDGSNARSREKCQADQCLIKVGGNWKQLESRWKEIGKKLEKIGEFTRSGGSWRERQ